jgi:hypothetical protein
MEQTPKKIDGRKNNPGRFGRKKPQTETVTQNQNTEQQTTSTMNETDNTTDKTTPIVVALTLIKLTTLKLLTKLSLAIKLKRVIKTTRRLAKRLCMKITVTNLQAHLKGE